MSKVKGQMSKLVSYEMKKLGTYLKILREEAGFSIREAATVKKLETKFKNVIIFI